MFAWEKEKDTIQNLPLDRIESFSFWHEDLKIQGEFDAKTYFIDIIGVTKPLEATIKTVEFKVSKKDNRAYYVRTKPLHHSQKEISVNDVSITFEIKVIPNNELKSKLAELGDYLMKVNI